MSSILLNGTHAVDVQPVRSHHREVLERVAQAVLQCARGQTARRLARAAQTLARTCRARDESIAHECRLLLSLRLGTNWNQTASAERTDMADATLEHCRVQHRLLLRVRQSRQVLR